MPDATEGPEGREGTESSAPPVAAGWRPSGGVKAGLLADLVWSSYSRDELTHGVNWHGLGHTGPNREKRPAERLVEGRRAVGEYPRT